MRSLRRAPVRYPAPGKGIVRSVLLLAILAASLVPLPAYAGEVLTNVALYVSAREILFFSAETGAWTSIRLDAGERILQRGADGNVAAVVTSQRAIGFSGILGGIHEVRVTEDETIDAFKVDGNVATLLTRLRALGFSAATGKWADIQRYFPGR
jgi:hypothetical protein